MGIDGQFIKYIHFLWNKHLMHENEFLVHCGFAKETIC